MASQNVDEYTSTESDASMSYLNEPDYDVPLIPMSAFKWVKPSTLPPAPFPNSVNRPSRPPQEKSSAKPKKPSDPKEFTLFQDIDTEEFMARISKREQERLPSNVHHEQESLVDVPAGHIRTRGKEIRGRGARLVPSAKAATKSRTVSSGPAQPRKSPRIAALNASKTRQAALAPSTGANKVAKRPQKSSHRTRRKAVPPAPGG